MREDFATPRASYAHHLGGEFPGAKADFSWTEEGHESSGALRTDYDFTGGGAYCVWVFAPEGLTGEETTLTLCVRSQGGYSVVVRLVDDTGQVHQHNCLLNGPGWQPIRLTLTGTREGLHWGGADDGVVHHPLKEVHIGPAHIGVPTGTLLIDEVALSADSGEVVTVDLAVEAGPATGRATGFLHSVGPTLPADEMLDPLRPRLFRLNARGAGLHGGAGAGTYERLTGLGARVQVCISDSYGYGEDMHWPGDDGDWGWWADVVSDTLALARERGYAVEWDIWNEADYGGFWKRDRDRFFETWARACRQIRAIDPESTIVGPSAANFNIRWLTAFLEYASANDVMPDIISWHEMSWTRLDYRFIPAHVQFIRDFVASLGEDERPISINEMIGPSLQTSPGVAVWFFAGLEKAAVDGACHACWPDKDDGVSNCGNSSLDGLLTHPHRQPRSTWWVYREYADLAGRLVGATPGVSVSGVACVDTEAREVRVILGRHGGAGEVNVRFTNLNEARDLLSNGEVRVVARRIPDSGWDALPRPIETIDASYLVTDGTLTVGLPDFEPSDAYAVRLMQPD